MSDRTETGILIGLAAIFIFSLMMNGCMAENALARCAKNHSPETCITTLNP